MDSSSSSLSETLRKDQRRRWSHGERVLVESYVERYPDLASDAQTLLELILEEFALRQEFGESPDLDEYASRFPSLASQLSQALLPASDPAPADTDAGSATDSASASLHGTTPIDCPGCAAPLRLPPGARADQLRCPQCGRRIHVLDETLSLLAKAGRTIAHFELRERVGRGQFGEVWLARDTQLRRDVAVKIPRRPDEDPFQAELFLREARAAARLRHPHIVPVYEAGQEDGSCYIVTAFIRGTTLKELLTVKKFTPQEAAELCRTLAEALEHAHRAGIVHRDFKPSNVLIDEDGAPHVADFGLAKHAGLDEITVTVEGHILGTPAYMPPEQARGESATAGPASDVYSLGVVLYEMLTEKRPFDGRLQVLMHRILTEAPKPPREIDKHIPRDLETICLKALSKSPAARYPTAQAFADDLDRYSRGQPIHARPESLAERAWRKGKRYWTVAALVIGVAALGLILGIRDNPPPEDPNRLLENLPMPIIPEHERPSPDFKHRVSIITEPPGARVVVYSMDFETARPDFASRKEGPTLTPTDLELTNGMYLVVAYTDQGFHEVVRSVPRYHFEVFGGFAHESTKWDEATKTLQWPSIHLFPYDLPDEKLVLCGGAESFEIDLAPLGEKGVQRWRVPPFQIAPHELSIAEYQRFDELRLWHKKRAPSLPAADLSWDRALNYAEARGLRLPDLLELEFLATGGGTRKHPWGDSPPPADNWNFDRPVDAQTPDQATISSAIAGQATVKGIDSGPLEWTMTRTTIGVGVNDIPGQHYIVRGGPAKLIGNRVPLGDHWASVNRKYYHPGLGVRCARSSRPRLKPEDFLTLVP